MPSSNSSTPTVTMTDRWATDTSKEVSGGRYLYCLVDVTRGEGPGIDVEGIGGNDVSLVTHEGIGAVVHPSDKLYDSDDVEQIKNWLITHQRVIDDAAAVCGTPIPFQFDVILEDGDAGVKRWLADRHDTIRRTLEAFCGSWEYRIHTKWDRSEMAATVRERDEQLAEIDEKRGESGEGERFLLDKQYDQRLQEALYEQKADIRERLVAELDDVAQKIVRHSPEPEVQGLGDSKSETTEWVARIALLAPESNEEVIGARLDEIATEPSVEIRFTGPWPPYSFTPEFMEEP